MIKQRTLFVLGAGASMDYGFSSGRDLLLTIYRELQSDKSKLSLALQDLGFVDSHVKEFAYALNVSMQPSVDAFLEHRPAFMDVGKAAIAAALIPHENPAKLGRRDTMHWYEYLFARMSTPKDEFSNNQVSFITFNYDRSLEFFLFNVIKYTYGIADEESADLLASIPIIHVHGDLGLPPWSSNGSQAVRKYATNTRYDLITVAKERIKIVHEKIDDDGEFIRARSELGNAKKVMLIGFGFNDTNIARLQLNAVRNDQQYWGTCYGFTELEKKNLETKIGCGLILASTGLKTLEALRNEVTLE
jgi:hypothetical protein